MSSVVPRNSPTYWLITPPWVTTTTRWPGWAATMPSIESATRLRNSAAGSEPGQASQVRVRDHRRWKPRNRSSPSDSSGVVSSGRSRKKPNSSMPSTTVTSRPLAAAIAAAVSPARWLRLA